MANELGALIEMGLLNVHLISGEDVIGKVFFDEKKMVYTIERPVMPNMQMDPNTRGIHVGLMPVRPYLDKTEKIDVLASHVLYFVLVTGKMEEIYQRFTSEIQLVDMAPDLKTILQS